MEIYRSRFDSPWKVPKSAARVEASVYSLRNEASPIGN